MPERARVGRRPPPAADAAHVSAFDRGFQLGDGIFETLRARGGRVTELAEHVERLHRSAAGLDITLPADLDDRLRDGIAALLAADGFDGPDGDASIRITVSRGAFRGRGLLPPDETVTPTVAIQAWPVVPAPAGPPRPRPAPRRFGGPTRSGEPARHAQDDLACRLRLRTARSAPGRRRRRAVPHHRRPPFRGDDREHLPGSPLTRRRRARTRDALRSTARSCRGRLGHGCWPGERASASDHARRSCRAPTWSQPMRRSYRPVSPGSFRSLASRASRSAMGRPVSGLGGHEPTARR